MDFVNMSSCVNCTLILKIDEDMTKNIKCEDCYMRICDYCFGDGKTNKCNICDFKYISNLIKNTTDEKELEELKKRQLMCMKKYDDRTKNNLLFRNEKFQQSINFKC
jgi:hypothetical protein